MGAVCSLDTQEVLEPKIVSSPSIDSFHTHYSLSHSIGVGSYSTVRLAYHNITQEQVAVKIVKQEGLSDIDNFGLRQEAEILRTTNHPNIVKCLDFFDEGGYYYIVLEYLPGGKLLDRIMKQTKYSEKNTRSVVKLLLAAIKHCHDRNIAHRDLKPENMLLVEEDNDINIKIADFGFASANGELMRSQVGTPEYVAPEILKNKPYGKGVDMWAVGCITYFLIAGQSPFQGKTLKSVFQKVLSGSFSFSSEVWTEVSDGAKDFINCLLKVDPSCRMNVDVALSHPWICELDDVAASSSLRTMSLSSFRSVDEDFGIDIHMWDRM